MRACLILLSLTILAACGDPRQACLNAVNKDLRIVQELISDTEATIERGYAIQTETRAVIYTDFCFGTARNNGRFNFCNRTAPVTTRTPVAVDLNAERAKLRSLREKEAELRREHQTKIARCEAEHSV